MKRGLPTAALALAAAVLVGLLALRPEGVHTVEEMDRLDGMVSVGALDWYRGKYSERVAVYALTYLSDGLEISGFLALPYDYADQQYSVIILNRGGNDRFGPMTASWAASYAQAGYIVLASQYREGPGSEGIDTMGGDDVNDVIKLIDFAGQLAFADRENIFMVGVSRGGLMTYRVLAMDDRIRAAVSLAGVSDVIGNYNDRVDGMKAVYERCIGGAPEELPEEYERRSAVCWADKINTPLLLLHGDADGRVDVSQSVRLAEELEKYGKEYKLIIYPGADHSLAGAEGIPELFDWLESHRKP